MKRLWWLGLLGLIALCVFCPYCRGPAIEDDLRAKALTCVHDADLDDDVLSISGRDVTLTGTVASRSVADEVEACIAAIPGIRVVHNEFTIRSLFGMKTESGTITLWGSVPSEADHAAVVAEAKALWGAGRVVDQLTVDPDVKLGPRPVAVVPTLAPLHQYREDLQVVIADGRAVVSGTVVSALMEERILGAAATRFPGYEIVDQLTVRPAVAGHEILQRNLDALLHGKVVEFATDSADLTLAGQQVLDEVAAILQTTPGRVEISGHTDNRATNEYNVELSRNRAESVKDYLVGKGIAADRLETVGYGETRPIAANDTPEGQQKNRRTEFNALKEI